MKQIKSIYSKSFLLIIMSIPAFIFCGIITVSILYSSIYIYSLFSSPPPLTISKNTIIYDVNGEEIGEYQFGIKRYYIPLQSISPYAKDATIATEDHNFYSHKGFDTKRIIGASLVNIRTLGKTQGASTITQQLARNLYLTHEKSWKRKLMEAYYTIRLETAYSKDELLEGYLNTIYYGSGAYGIEAASATYFNKSAEQLTVEEAALLVGIPKAPTYYSPYTHYEEAVARQKVILEVMKKEKLLSNKEFNQAVTAHISLQKQVASEKETAPSYYQDAMLSSLKNELQIPNYLIDQGGLHIYTSLHPGIQKIAEEAYQKIIPSSTQLQTAIVVQDSKNGGILALVGGKNYEESAYNRATMAKRQPGSTFKPFLYYAALEQGFTPSTLFKSEYTELLLDDNVTTYSPRNYGNAYSNQLMTMQQALALSDNIYAVKTIQYIGSHHLIETSRNLGITSPLDDVPSLALGVSPISPLEMVNAYSHIANGGSKVAPSFITKVVTSDGKVLYEKKNKNVQVLEPNHTYVLKKMMSGMFDTTLNAEHALVTGSALSERMTQKYYGKSGSTSVDSWMIGFTPDIVTGVWIGYDQGKLLTQKKEQSYSKEIWLEIMEKTKGLVKNKKENVPNNVVAVKVEPTSGLLYTKGCSKSRTVYYLKGTEPTEYCKDIPEEKKEKKRWYQKWFD